MTPEETAQAQGGYQQVEPVVVRMVEVMFRDLTDGETLRGVGLPIPMLLSLMSDGTVRWAAAADPGTGRSEAVSHV